MMYRMKKTWHRVLFIGFCEVLRCCMRGALLLAEVYSGLVPCFFRTQAFLTQGVWRRLV